MKTRIYLFCNHGYGSAFLETFQEAASGLGDYDLHVIVSALSTRASLLSRIARVLRHPLRTWRNYRTTDALGVSCKVTHVPDVNAGNFIESVPPGSIGFVAGFNQIFRRRIIDRFSTFLNFHPSLLPYYRGAIPSYWALKNGEASTGLTVHSISEQIDAGDILYQEAVAINQYMSESELDGKIATVGACYLRECLRALAANTPLRQHRIEPVYSVKVDYVPSKRA